jgi:hypothetical protein
MVGMIFLGCVRAPSELDTEAPRGFRNEPTEFKGDPWGLSLKDFRERHPSARKVGTKNCSEIYTIDDEPASLDGISVNVQYHFSKDGFHSVDILLSENYFYEMREVLKLRFGEDSAIFQKDGGLVWWGSKVLIVLKKGASEVGKSLVQAFSIELYDKSVENCRQEKTQQIDRHF